MKKETGLSAVPIERRDLEAVLGTSRNILERLTSVDGRLQEMTARIFGDEPSVEGASSDKPTQAGILGSFQSTNEQTNETLVSVENLISRIEGAI